MKSGDILSFSWVFCSRGLPWCYRLSVLSELTCNWFESKNLGGQVTSLYRIQLSSMPSCNCSKAPLMWTIPPVSVIFVKLNLCSVQNFCSPFCFHAVCAGAQVFHVDSYLSCFLLNQRTWGEHQSISVLTSVLFCCQKSHKSFFILEVSIHLLFNYRISLSFYATQGLGSAESLQRLCVCSLSSQIILSLFL